MKAEDEDDLKASFFFVFSFLPVFLFKLLTLSDQMPKIAVAEPWFL
jgi:hypothetical protein